MSIEHIPANDWASIGALLARCDYIELSKQDEDRWIAELQFGTIHLWEVTGKTQLEAIRNAVEAAEQGVME